MFHEILSRFQPITHSISTVYVKQKLWVNVIWWISRISFQFVEHFLQLFFLARVFFNVSCRHSGHSNSIIDFFFVVHQTIAMYAVMKFYHMVRHGISFKVNETFIELWQNSYESDDNKSSTTISLCPDEDLDYLNCGGSQLHHAEDIFECDEDISDNDCDERKCPTGDGSDENVSLLVAYDDNSVDSLWHKSIKSSSFRNIKFMM